jgi:hypothetical protein
MVFISTKRSIQRGDSALAASYHSTRIERAGAHPLHVPDGRLFHRLSEPSLDIVQVERGHFHVLRQVRQHLAHLARQDVHHAARHIARRDRLGERNGRPRIRLAREHHARIARSDDREMLPASPSSAGRGGATIATTPIGSGTVKREMRPPSGSGREQALVFVRPAGERDGPVDRRDHLVLRLARARRPRAPGPARAPPPGLEHLANR